MKRSGVCPKCSGSRVARIPMAKNSGNYLTTGGLLPTTFGLERVVCLQCGFVEVWVADAADLPEIEKRFSE